MQIFIGKKVSEEEVLHIQVRSQLVREQCGLAGCKVSEIGYLIRIWIHKFFQEPTEWHSGICTSLCNLNLMCKT